MNIIVCENKESAIETAVRRLEDVLCAGDEPILLLLSGGSALSVVEALPADMVDKNVTVSVLDERYDQSNSNFEQLTSLPFYDQAMESGAQSIDTRTKDFKSLEDLAQRFEKALIDWRLSHPDGKVVVTQGVGVDGHTAGIMPFPEDVDRFNELFEQDNLVVGYDAGEKNSIPQRVTVTATFLRTWVDYSIVFLSGDDRRDVLKKIADNDMPKNVFPANIINDMKRAEVISDQQIK